LLEFALEELYQQRAGDGTLTFAAYRSIGGVEGALARRAESVYLSLPPSTRESLPAALRRLVTTTAVTGDAFNRRSAALEEFAPGSQSDLIRSLIEARLCVSELAGDGRPVVSIAHEALLRHWPRVRDWLEENREVLRAHGRLAVSAERWHVEGRRADLLLADGRPLEEALAVQRAGVALSNAESELIVASLGRARRAKRLRTSAVAGLAILTLLAIGAALVANSQRLRAQIEASTTRETMDFMVSMFAIADPTESNGNSVTVREILDRGARDVEKGLRDRPVVRSSLMTAMGRAYTGLGLPVPARRLLTEALEVRRQAVGSTSRDATETQNALATAIYLEGAYRDAEREYRSALAGARRLSPDGDALVAEILNGLGDTLLETGAIEEAKSCYHEALGIDERLHGRKSVEAARTMKGLGLALYYSGRYADAEPLWTEALANRRKAYGPGSWKVAESLNDLGALRFQTGRYSDALRDWREAMAIAEEVLGKDHPYVGNLANNIGRVQLIDGEISRAAPQLSRALSIARHTLPAMHDDLVLPLNSLAMIDIARRDFPSAESKLDEALKICDMRKYWLTDQVLTNLADVYAKTGRAPQAEELLARARTLLEKQYPRSEMPEEAWRYALQDAVLATTYAAEKKYPEARKLLTEALPIVRKRFGEGRYYTRDLEERLARLPR
jgi:tetratricopeptide (TPR) repeat protein